VLVATDGVATNSTVLVENVVTVVVVSGALAVTRTLNDVAAAEGVSVFTSDDASAVVVTGKDGAEGRIENDALASSVMTIVGDSTVTSNSAPKLCTSVAAGKELCALIRFKNSMSLSHGLELNAELEVSGVVVTESMTFSLSGIVSSGPFVVFPGDR